MNIPFEIPEDYLKAFGSPAPDYLHNLERETHLKIPKPHMITGFAQGRLLSLLSCLVLPRFILEIGTFTGYGSLCLAEGLAPEGKLITIDNSEENVWLARKYFSVSPFLEQIELRVGNASEVLQTLSFPWDLAYIDADKTHNLLYLKTVWPQVRKGGMVLIDNVFARGGVFRPESEQKGYEKEVAKMNRLIPDLFPESHVTILPIRDGLTVIRKV